MKASITPNRIAPDTYIQDGPAKQNDSISESTSDLEARIGELDNEPKKQKIAAENRAKLMQTIWGDNFRSDSLH
jgi:cell division protein FtsB